MVYVLEGYTCDLIKAGYNYEDLHKYITPGIVGFEKRVTREKKGGYPAHRKGKVIKQGTYVKKTHCKWGLILKTTQNQMKTWGVARSSDQSKVQPLGPPVPPYLSPGHLGGG